jgi:hypothetical protein
MVEEIEMVTFNDTDHDDADYVAVNNVNQTSNPLSTISINYLATFSDLIRLLLELFT